MWCKEERGVCINQEDVDKTKVALDSTQCSV